MYVQLENAIPVRWPVGEYEIRVQSQDQLLPEYIPDELALDLGFGRFIFNGYPSEYNAQWQNIAEITPVLKGDGKYHQSYEITEKYTPEERAAIERELTINSIVQQTQQRLDDFARTRNYDGILSLATYATSTVQKFQTEGQYGVESRDATWEQLYLIMAEVEAGTRPMPAGFADIEPDLPVLVWPS